MAGSTTDQFDIDKMFLHRDRQNPPMRDLSMEGSAVPLPEAQDPSGYIENEMAKIAAYIDSLSIKTTAWGGFDKTEVYGTLQELYWKFSALVEWQRGERAAAVERQTQGLLHKLREQERHIVTLTEANEVLSLQNAELSTGNSELSAQNAVLQTESPPAQEYIPPAPSEPVQDPYDAVRQREAAIQTASSVLREAKALCKKIEMEATVKAERLLAETKEKAELESLQQLALVLERKEQLEQEIGQLASRRAALELEVDEKQGLVGETREHLESIIRLWDTK